MTAAGSSISVLIADDSRVVRERMAVLIREVPGVSAVVETEDVTSTIKALRQHLPSILILDIGMPGGSGLDVLQQMNEEQLKAAVIVLTNYPYPEYEKAACAGGALAFLNKSTEFLKAVDLVRNLVVEQVQPQSVRPPVLSRNRGPQSQSSKAPLRGEAAAAAQIKLLERIGLADRSGANALLDLWLEEHPRNSLLPEVLEPVLLRIGEEWQTRKSYTLAQTYVAAKVAEDALTRLAAVSGRDFHHQARYGPVVLGNIEDDHHGLGRRMVATFLRTYGWQVEDLGNDVPAADLVDAAVSTGARIIGVSAMMLSTARNIRRVREEIDGRELTGRLQLAVGGAVFLVKPELIAEVGGDGCAPNALSAVRLCEELWAKSVATELRT